MRCDKLRVLCMVIWLTVGFGLGIATAYVIETACIVQR